MNSRNADAGKESWEFIDQLCDQFERAIENNESPRIADYLKKVTTTEDEILLFRELLHLELELTDSDGATRDRLREKYLSEFPERSSIIVEVFQRARTRIWGGNPTDHSPQQNSRLRPQKSPTVSLTTDSITVPPLDDTPTINGDHTDGDSPARSFSDYEILHRIAKGGMGVVFKARHRKLNRLVALKMIRSGEFADDEQVQRFHAEAEAAAKLDHPGIVPVYEVGEANSQHFFSMAFVDGRSLAARVEDDGPLEAKQAASFMKTAAEAVQFAHDNGIVHRDIKPHNILLDKNVQPRITDFGLAKLQGRNELTKTGQIMGTPSYMAPEQAGVAVQDVGPTTDVYALGATLYFLLTGRPPFQAASPMETIRQVIDDEPVSPRRLNSAIPRDLETICLKCLNKDLRRRYSSAQEVADELQRWMDRKPILARPISPFERAWRWCRRKPAMAGSLFVLMVMLVAFSQVISYMRLHNRKEQQRIELISLVKQLESAEVANLPGFIEELNEYRVVHGDHFLVERLALADDNGEAAKATNLRLALVERNSEFVEPLFNQLLIAEIDDVPVIISSLEKHREKLSQLLWNIIQRGTAEERIRAAAALARYDSNNELWEEVSDDVVTSLVTVPMWETNQWIEMLLPVDKKLSASLQKRFFDSGSSRNEERPLVASALSHFGRETPELLVKLMLSANSRSVFQPLMNSLRPHANSIKSDLLEILDQSYSGDDLEKRDDLLRQKANSAVCLMAIGEAESIWPLLNGSPNPSLRSFLIDRIAWLGGDAALLARRIRQDPDPDKRYALILALGHFDVVNMSERQRNLLLDLLSTLYQNEPDSGVLSAIEWTLRHWKQNRRLNTLRHKESSPDQGRHWFVNSQGQRFTVLQGSLEDRVADNKTPPGEKTVQFADHQFAIGTHEVTLAQFARYDNKHMLLVGARNAAAPDRPVNSVSWYQAVAYCNWLNQQEGIPRDQWCYLPDSEGEYKEGMVIPSDYMNRTGYRLPIRSEWDLACRAGTKTRYFFGEPLELLRNFAWFRITDHQAYPDPLPVGKKLPNPYGLFDVHGNVAELCDIAPDGEIQIVDSSPNRIARSGGGIGGNQLSLRFEEVRMLPPGNVYPIDRMNTLGFRLARTIPKSGRKSR